MTRRNQLLTAGLLIGVPILFNFFFALLQTAFHYPDVLSRPAEEILSQFHAGGTRLIGLWYGFALTAALLLPAAILLRRTFDHESSPLLDLATPLAVAASLVQLLGLIRWPLLVPVIARLYTDPATDASARAAAVVVFQAFHQYAGVAVGEHLGYLFTAAWTAVIAVAMLHKAPFPSWLALLGLVAAAGILVGMLQPVGVALAGPINALGYLLWSLWLMGAGIAVFRARPQEAAALSPPSPMTMSR